jgi:hypothetical protein
MWLFRSQKVLKMLDIDLLMNLLSKGVSNQNSSTTHCIGDKFDDYLKGGDLHCINNFLQKTSQSIFAMSFFTCGRGWTFVF